MSQKGIYPYDWMDSFEKFEATSLPSKEDFFSLLYGEGISEKDYLHAKEVWKEFGIKNMEEYHDLYLKGDVMILTDVFEQFRKTCLEHYELDPCWYYTAPELSWDAFLKESKVELELLTDMLLFFEEGTRGGISMITKTYAEANHKYLKEYDPGKESKFFIYLDENNFYGWGMLNDLPVGDFEWMTEEELENWENYPCFLEVDLDYPKELHDSHNDYPLAAETMKINGVKKLVPNLRHKKKYIYSTSQKLEAMHRLGNEVKETSPVFEIPRGTLDEELYRKEHKTANDGEECF